MSTISIILFGTLLVLNLITYLDKRRDIKKIYELFGERFTMIQNIHEKINQLKCTHLNLSIAHVEIKQFWRHYKSKPNKYITTYMVYYKCTDCGMTYIKTLPELNTKEKKLYLEFLKEN